MLLRQDFKPFWSFKQQRMNVWDAADVGDKK